MTMAFIFLMPLRISPYKYIPNAIPMDLCLPAGHIHIAVPASQYDSGTDIPFLRFLYIQMDTLPRHLSDRISFVLPAMGGN